MSSKQTVGGGGSILLKLLILFLVVVLGYSVYFPGQQWNKQDRDLLIARERMDNLNQAGQLYVFFNRSFPQTMEELIFAIDTTFVEDASPFQFSYEPKSEVGKFIEMEKLEAQQLDGLGDPNLLAHSIDSLKALMRDSLLVTLEDTMRIDVFHITDLGLQNFMLTDSTSIERYHTLVFADMKPLYQGLGTDTLHLVSEMPIRTLPRKAGVASREYWAATNGLFEDLPQGGRFTRGDTVRQAVKNFSLTLPIDEISTCPSTLSAYEMRHVNKYSYKGDYLFQIDGEEGDLLSTDAHRHAFLNELKAEASDAIGNRFAQLTEEGIAAGDPTYQVPQDEKAAIVIEETLAQVATLRSGRRFVATGETFLIARSDSIDYFSADEKRETELFSPFQGAMAEQFTALLADSLVADLVNRTRFERDFQPVQVDTVGLAFYSPIIGDEIYTTGINRIFEVDPPENHGSIYNGTKSWE
jgi:hypothetical protein